MEATKETLFLLALGELEKQDILEVTSKVLQALPMEVRK